MGRWGVEKKTFLEKKPNNSKICFNIEALGFPISYFEIVIDVIQNPR